MRRRCERHSIRCCDFEPSVGGSDTAHQGEITRGSHVGNPSDAIKVADGRPGTGERQRNPIGPSTTGRCVIPRTRVERTRAGLPTTA
jgi:hypothetical protein